MHVNRRFKVLGLFSLATLPLMLAFQNAASPGSVPVRCPMYSEPTENGLISHASFEDGTKLRARDNPRYPRLLLQAEEQRYLPVIIYPRFIDQLDPHTGISRKVLVVPDDAAGCRPGNQALMIQQGPVPKEYCENIAALPRKVLQHSSLEKFSFDDKVGDCKKKEKMEVWVLPEHYGSGRSGRITQFAQGERRFFGFSLKLDPTYEAPEQESDWTIHMQVHQDSASEVSGRSQPSLTLSAFPTKNPNAVNFRVRVKEEKERRLIEHALPADDFITLQKGRWYQFAFDILPDTNRNNGHVRFFVRNDKGVIGGPYTYQGAWSYEAKKPEDRTFNVSVGLYRGRQQKLHKFYLDEIRFGKNMGNVAPWALKP